MKGPKVNRLKELELAPGGKHWKSIVNKIQNQRQEKMQPELKQSAIFRAARRKFRSKFLDILGN